MTDYKSFIQDAFNKTFKSLGIDFSINDSKNLIIKELNSSNKKKEISTIEYYSKRYLQHSISNFNIENNNYNIAYLEKPIEDLLFTYLTAVQGHKMYHYTSYESLLKIFDKKKLRMSSIAGLNDRDELSYFDATTNSNIGDPYHYKRIETFNNRFLLSCSYLKDDLNQWRLYGNDGCGVSIEFEIQKGSQNGFYIGNILYGTNVLDELNATIDELYQKYNIAFVFNQFSIWKHFFKSEYWDYEKEIRLIYWNTKVYIESEYEWSINKYNILTKYHYIDLSNLPVRITKIILGPKLSESELNKAQLKQFLREKEYEELAKNVEKSDIKCYR